MSLLGGGMVGASLIGGDALDLVVRVKVPFKENKKMGACLFVEGMVRASIIGGDALALVVLTVFTQKSRAFFFFFFLF